MRPLALTLVACSMCAGHAFADDDASADDPVVDGLAVDGTRPDGRVIVEGATVIPRNFYWSIGAGWVTRLTGPDGGPSLEAEVYPGGRFGRVGFTAYFRGQLELDGLDIGLITAGLTYEAAASRPKLTLNMHAEVGFTYGESFPVVGVGVKTQLWIKGPFAVAINSTGHMLLDGTDSRLQLGTSLLIAIGM